MTLLCELVGKSFDINGYLTYVFENKEEECYEKKYIRCTRFPNWNTVYPNVGETGYVSIKDIVAGVDQWWNAGRWEYYRYNMTQFIDFVPKPTVSQDNVKITL